MIDLSKLPNAEIQQHLHDAKAQCRGFQHFLDVMLPRAIADIPADVDVNLKGDSCYWRIVFKK